MAYIKIRINKTEDEIETVVEVDTKGIEVEYEYKAITDMTKDIIKYLKEEER